MTKEEAIKHLEDMKKGLFLWDMTELIEVCISALSADVRPNIHGHWIEHDVYDECSVCLAKKDNLIRGDFNFCPKCGADMREPIGEKG